MGRDRSRWLSWVGGLAALGACVGAERPAPEGAPPSLGTGVAAADPSVAPVPATAAAPATATAVAPVPATAAAPATATAAATAAVPLCPELPSGEDVSRACGAATVVRYAVHRNVAPCGARYVAADRKLRVIVRVLPSAEEALGFIAAATARPPPAPGSGNLTETRPLTGIGDRASFSVLDWHFTAHRRIHLARGRYGALVLAPRGADELCCEPGEASGVAVPLCTDVQMQEVARLLVTRLDAARAAGP